MCSDGWWDMVISEHASGIGDEVKAVLLSRKLWTSCTVAVVITSSPNLPYVFGVTIK